MYEKKQPDSVNHARVEVFLQKYKPNTRIAMASCVKKMGSSSFPPSSRVIKVRIKRKRYFCGIWNNAATANPTIFQHKYCGWFLENESSKSASHHEDSVDKFLYDDDDDDDDDIFSNNGLSESEANSEDNN